MIGADVEGGGNFPGKLVMLAMVLIKQHTMVMRGVNQSDTVSIPAVAHGQSIHTRGIASADPYAMRSSGVHPLAI